MEDFYCYNPTKLKYAIDWEANVVKSTVERLERLHNKVLAIHKFKLMDAEDLLTQAQKMIKKVGEQLR